MLRKKVRHSRTVAACMQHLPLTQPGLDPVHQSATPNARHNVTQIRPRPPLVWKMRPFASPQITAQRLPSRLLSLAV
jgi:hypothetical protein